MICCCFLIISLLASPCRHGLAPGQWSLYLGSTDRWSSSQARARGGILEPGFLPGERAITWLVVKNMAVMTSPIETGWWSNLTNSIIFFWGVGWNHQLDQFWALLTLGLLLECSSCRGKHQQQTRIARLLESLERGETLRGTLQNAAVQRLEFFSLGWRGLDIQGFTHRDGPGIADHFEVANQQILWVRLWLETHRWL